ncbi:hypothetical protein [Microbispora sp. GKU 823]|uniref:hypothetical protein n=1 Tax=Microbispora sp. GKU 823 TaxID=1652100 RepID=UPI0009A3190C|nr:hypothetical protein [Microbispora sp. GKU 823]OPG11412.1 hypothetical protein B1L11_20595 [Microbispora sp. GKU 823]
MGRTAGPRVAVALVCACAAMTCAALMWATSAAAFPAPVRAAAGASRTADDPDGPGLRVGVCLDVDVIVDLHAEVGIGGPGCTPPTRVPPPRPPRSLRRRLPRSPHRRPGTPRIGWWPRPGRPRGRLWRAVPRPRATPRPTPSPSRSPVARVPAMRAIAPVRHRNPLGTLTVVVVLSVAIAAAGAAAFRR